MPLFGYYHANFTKTTAAPFQKSRLKSHSEITFDLLYAILIPRSVLVTTCRITGEPRALQLVHASVVCTMKGPMYDLVCESIDVDDTPSPDGNQHPGEAELGSTTAAHSFGRVTNRIILPQFGGTIKINELDCYPLKYHAHEKELRESLVARGRKWVSYNGVHHLVYKGLAASAANPKGLVRYNVCPEFTAEFSELCSYNLIR